MQMRGDQRSRPCHSVFVHRSCYLALRSRDGSTAPHSTRCGKPFFDFHPSRYTKIVNLRRIKTINFAPLRERRCD